MNLFSFLGAKTDADKLPDIFPIPILQKDFVAIDVENTFSRILTDTLERTQGIPDEKESILWDNCLVSENRDGLVTLLSKAMADKKELFLVYIESTKVIRKATSEEQEKIKVGYEEKAESVKLGGGAVGLYVSFKNYLRADMIRFWSALEFCAVGGLWKQANISKTVQIKINDLRGSVSLNDSAAAKAQAKAMAEGMSEGLDILADAKDVIESLTPDMTATNATLELIAKKKSDYLGLPPTYFGAEGKSSMNDTGKGDSRKVERGLKNYFLSVIKPVLDGLLEIEAEYKSEDADGIDSALKTLETMDRTSNEFLGAENKTKIVNKAFGLDEDEVGDGPEEPEEGAVDPLTGLPIEKKPGEVPPKGSEKPPAKSKPPFGG